MPTIDKLEPAQDMARMAIEQKMAFCANITPGVLSIYSWAGDIVQDQEVSILIKTSPDQAKVLRQFIAESHPYDVSAILTWDIQSTQDFPGCSKEALSKD